MNWLVDSGEVVGQAVQGTAFGHEIVEIRLDENHLKFEFILPDTSVLFLGIPDFGLERWG